MTNRLRGRRGLPATAAFALAFASVAVSGATAAAATPAAITVHGAASTTASSTTTIALPVPAGAQPGDLLLASLSFGSTNTSSQPTLAAPTGWTLVLRTNFDRYGALAVYRHVLAAGETGPAWRTNTSVGAVSHIAAFAGVDPANPIDGSAGRTSGRGTTFATPSLTTSAAGDALVASFSGYRNNGGSNAWSVPSGMAELGDAANGPRSASLDEAVQANPGSSGSRSASTGNRLDFAITALTALRAVAAPAPSNPPVITSTSATAISASAATISWTTDQPASSQVDYGPTTAYGASSTLDPTAATSHAQVLSGLAAATTYHYRPRSTNAAGQTTLGPDGTFLTGPASTGPVPVIIDTDIFSSADDVGALSIAFALQLRGEAQVAAIGVNTRLSRPAVATSSWRCAAAIAQYYGFGSVPIGTAMPNNGTDVNTADFTGPCSRLAAAATPAPDSAVNVFRRALVGRPDGSVVMIGIGYFGNLAALLASPPDAISPLSGHDLVARKVKSLVVMAGGFPSRAGENNLSGDPGSAQAVASGWPTKIVWSGYEVGDAIHTGQTISATQPAASPVRVAYEAYVGPNNWIYSYDLTAAYHAIRPNDPLLTEVGPGTNVVDGSGGNAFQSGAGQQWYLSLADPTGLDSALETLLDVVPGAPAPDTTPPTISNLSYGSVTGTSATITWTTDEPATSQVEYGPTTSYGSTTPADGQLVLSHSVALSSLAPGTAYHLRVHSSDAAGNPATSPDTGLTTSTAPSPPPGPNDTFDSNVLDPSAWTVTADGSTVAAANQELDITHPAGGWTKGTVASAVPYDQTGRAVQVQQKRAANNGLGGATYGETSVYLSADASHYAYFFTAGGSLSAWVNRGAGEVNLTPSWPAYNATTMQWLRFREAGGTLYWEYASGATTPGAWTVLASTPDPFPMTSVTLKLVAGANVSAVDVARFDNVSTS